MLCLFNYNAFFSVCSVGVFVGLFFTRYRTVQGTGNRIHVLYQKILDDCCVLVVVVTGKKKPGFVD